MCRASVAETRDSGRASTAWYPRTRDRRPRQESALLPSLRLALPLALAIFVAAPTVAQNAVAGPRLVELELAPTVPFNTLLEAGLDLVEVRGARRVRLLEWPGDEAVLARLGGQVTLIDADPARTAAERAAADLAGRPAPRGQRVQSAVRPDGVFRTEVLPPFGSGSMGGYWTLAEVKMKLDDLVAGDTQNLVADKLDTVGTSVQGRPIWGLKIAKAVAGPDTRPVAFFNALTHAREPEGMQALFYFVDDLRARYGTDPEAAYLLENRVIYIVPVVNPDGYFKNESTNPGGGGLWRKNMRNNNGNPNDQDGVDINRNYGFQWGFDNAGSSGTASSETYRGPSAFSEPETRAQRDIVVTLQPKTGLSFHTYGDLLLHPWGYTTTAPSDSNTFYEWEDDMSLGNGYLAGQGIRVLYPVNGEFNDWTYGDVALKPRAFTWTPEVGTPADNFWPAPSRIVPLAQEALRLAWYAASIAGPFARVERADVQGGPLAAGSSRLVSVRARNKGVSGNAGPGLGATMSSLSPGASVIPGSVAYPTLAPLTSGDALAGGAFQIAVDDTVTAGRLLRFRVEFTATGDFYSRDTVELICGVPTLVAAEDASSGLGQWTTGSWGIVSGDPVHPSLYFADSPSGAYANGVNNPLTHIATLDLSAGVHAYALYDARWQFESDYDCGLIEASLDGVAWTPLRATGSSLGSSISGGTQPAGQPVYDGARNLWRGERADLSAFTGSLGGAVRLRYRVLSDAGSQLAGLDFDSLRVVVYDPATQPGPVAVGEGPPTSRIELAAPAPDPVRGPARFAFTLPAAGAVRLELFDLQGRRVATLADAVLPAGRHVSDWDGRDPGGHRVSAGVYLARLSGAMGGATRRFIVLR
jgi:carboxypeptidase T